MSLQIVYMPLETLVPYAKNSRTHSDGQVAQIAASIREFGWTNPVLIDELGTILAGHGRVMAARKLGEAQAPCIVLAGLTEAQRAAYVIADNKLALNAGWDDAMLAAELQRLTELDYDTSLLGFTGAELAPLGVRLLADVVGQFAVSGYVAGVEQDEAVATWEPAIDRPPAFRPDLALLEAPRG